MDYKTSIATIAAALALYASAGCKKDEPVVVRPRVSCCHNDCNSHSHDINGNYVVKPAHNLEQKYEGSNRARPELSGHNPFDEAGRQRMPGVQYVIQLPPGYSATTVGPNGLVITARFRNVEGGAVVVKPTGTNAGISGSASGASSGNVPQGSGTGACFDSSRTLEERARSCAERLPTADEFFGPETLDEVVDDVAPRHGRG